MKKILTFLGLTLLLIFMFIFPNSVKALSNEEFVSLRTHLGSSCPYLILFNYGQDNKDYYFCNLYSYFGATIDNTYKNGNDNRSNLFTNFYGIKRIQASQSHTGYQVGNTRSRGIGYYNQDTNTWTQVCSSSTCSLSGFDIKGNGTYHNGYIIAVLSTESNPNTNLGIYYNNINSPLFYGGYNLLYNKSIDNYFTGATNYFGQPTNAKGSSIEFSGDELSSNLLNFSYGYINTYMYDFTTITNEDTLISHTYTYDNLSLNGNFELGFIVTTKRYNDTPLIVHAITDDTYACSVTPILEQDDYNYQYYINCPSVPFTNIDTLKIVVNGANEWYDNTNESPKWFNTNYLFNFVNNNEFVGISNVLRKPTDTPPTPIHPDTPPQDDVITGINDINDSINNSNIDDFNDSFSSFNNSIASNNVISDLLLLPINMLQNIVSSINGTCSPFNLGTIKGNTITLPCIDLQSILGNGIWVFIDIVSCGLFVLVIRKRMVDIFNDLSSLKDRGNVLE